VRVADLRARPRRTPGRTAGASSETSFRHAALTRCREDSLRRPHPPWAATQSAARRGRLGRL